MLLQPANAGIHAAVICVMVVSAAIDLTYYIGILHSEWAIGAYSIVGGFVGALLILQILVSFKKSQIVPVPSPFSPGWTVMFIDCLYMMLALLYIIPELLWGNSVLNGLTIVLGGILGYSELMILSLTFLSIFVGSVLLGVGISAYFIFQRSKEDMLSWKVAELVEQMGYNYEEGWKVAGVLVDSETVGKHTVEYWSEDVVSDDWEWAFQPEGIRQSVEAPSFSMNRVILPITTESHRRWRGVGFCLLLLGFITTTLFIETHSFPLLLVVLTVILAYYTTAMLFGSQSSAN